MDILQFVFLLITSFSVTYTYADSAVNVSDSLAVETTVETVKGIQSLTPETKSKTEKRDSSDQIGSTIYTHKEDEPFRPITSENYQSQRFAPSPAPSIFQPTTIRYTAEEAAPQAYYDKLPNVGRDAINNNGNIQYVAPSHAYRGPFKDPYEIRLEQTHPQQLQPSHQQQEQQQLQQQQYHQHRPQQQFLQVEKTPASIRYITPSSSSGFLPLEVPIQKSSPLEHSGHHKSHQNTESPHQNLQHKQHFQQQPQYVFLQKQPQQQQQQQQKQQQQQQQQQQQYQQPAGQQTHYIIAIPLSYVRQLQHQLAAQQESHESSPPPAAQHQQQSTYPSSLQSSRSHLPPLIVLQPVNSVGGGSSSDSYRLQSPIHYASQVPPNAEINSHAQMPPVSVSQQLTFPMNLVLAAGAMRPRQTVYPSSQLLYVQPQLIRQLQQQQLQLQIKQHQHLPRYVSSPDQQRPNLDEQHAQKVQKQQQSHTQQHEHQRAIPITPKSTVKQILSPLPSPVMSSVLPPHTIPTKATSSHTFAPLPLHSSLSAAPPVFFYNPSYVQPPPLEQHPLPPLPYSSYLQAQLGSVHHASSPVKLTSSGASLASQNAFPSHFYPVQNSVTGPQSLLVPRVPLQFHQPSQQQSSVLPTFFSRPAVYMTSRDDLQGIGIPTETGGGLPYFIHPAGVHYGTHLYNPSTPVGGSQKHLESVVNANVDSQQLNQLQHLQPEQNRKQHQQRQQQQHQQLQQHQQQRLGSAATSSGNDDNNTIVKYP